MPSLMGRNLMNLCFTNFKRSVPNPINPKEEEPIIKNFNSLYDLIPDPDPTSVSDPFSPSGAATPDLRTVLASRRFFFTSPGRSNSIVDSFVEGGVAIPRDSPDPYWDFRRSMEEMVEARGLFDVRSDWECLHELLLCYLALNPNSSTHKFIFGAFSDLLVCLMDYPAMSSHRKRD